MIHESRIVFVAWQCPEPRNRAFYPVARIHQRDDGPRYELAFIHGVHDAIKVGFRPFFGPNVEALHRSQELPAFLANRLMSPQRPDYAEHVGNLGLNVSAAPLTILARSEGSKVTDNLEVFAHPAFDPVSSTWVYFAFCRGIRHVNSEAAVSTLSPGESLVVESEPQNEFDRDALLLLRVDSQLLGYVPRTLIDDLNVARSSGHEIRATVERVNPSPAPVQQRLLVRIEVPARVGFRPLSTRRYQPISPHATQFAPEHLMQC